MSHWLQAKEFFEKAAENEDPAGYYYLGVMYFKGIGVKINVERAAQYFMRASSDGQSKARYQEAEMFRTGVGFRKDLLLVHSVLSFSLFGLTLPYHDFFFF